MTNLNREDSIIFFQMTDKVDTLWQRVNGNFCGRVTQQEERKTVEKIKNGNLSACSEF